METRYIEMYSLCNWEPVLRKRFCLGYDPYYFDTGSTLGIAAEKARELLRSLGVFYYRDIENSRGILLQPTEGAELHKITGKEAVFDPPLECRFFNVKVLYPSMVPVDYAPPTKITLAEKYQEYKTKWGDTKLWLAWAQPIKITQVTAKFVRRSLQKNGEKHGEAIVD